MRCPLKGVVSTAALAAWAAGSAAAGVSAGDSIASMGLGVGIPLSGLDLGRFGGGSEDPGGPGVAVGPQFLHYMTPNVAVGGDMTYQGFSDRDVVRPSRPDVTVGGSLLDVEAVVQYLVSPLSRVSPYLIGGMGLSLFAAHVRDRRDPSDVLLASSSTGLAMSMGAGLQATLTDTVSAMGDLRWHFATTDSADFGTGTANALALMFRMGWKF